MITFPITVQVIPLPNNVPPFTYTWSVVNIANPSSVSITPASGVIDPNQSLIITGEFTAADEASILATTVNLTITDSSDVECFRIIPITLTNPCAQITMSAITHSAPFNFTTVATGGTAPYDYNWSYDTDLFEEVTSVAGTITLALKEDVTDIPSFTTISCTSVDDLGCSEIVTLSYIIPQPIVFEYSQIAACQPDGNAVVSHMCVNPYVYPGSVLDWDTFSIDLPGPGWNYTLHDDTCGTIGRQLTIVADTTVQPGIYPLPYSISSTAGVPSESADINMTVPDCPINTSTISIAPGSPYVIDCSLVATDPFVIDLEPLISSTGTIDWDSFQFVVGNVPVATNPIVTSLAGGQALYDSINHTITYTVPSAAGADPFKWLICNTDGVCSQTTSSVLITECNEAPIAIDDLECAECGVTIPISPASNDTLNGIFSSLDLQTFPQQADYFVNGHLLNYTPFNEITSAIDLFSYTVTNNNGLVSNTANVLVNLACAGTETNASICGPGYVVTPYDDMNGTPLTGGTWVLHSSPGTSPAAPAAYNDSIDFTGATPGTHVYRYTHSVLSCSHTAQISYEVGAQTTVLNDTIATATSLGALTGSVNPTSLLTSQDNTTYCPGTLVNLSAEPSPAGWPATGLDGDLWYSVVFEPDANDVVNGQVNIQLPNTGGIGNYNPQSIFIAVYEGTPGSPVLLQAGSAFSAGNNIFTYPFYKSIATTETYYIRISSLSIDGPGEFTINVQRS